MVRFERWSEEEKQYVLVHMSTIPANSVTCKKHKIRLKDAFDLTKIVRTIKDTQTQIIREISTKHSIGDRPVHRQNILS